MGSIDMNGMHQFLETVNTLVFVWNTLFCDRIHLLYSQQHEYFFDGKCMASVQCYTIGIKAFAVNWIALDLLYTVDVFVIKYWISIEYMYSVVV